MKEKQGPNGEARGVQREKALSRDTYFSKLYFSEPQLFSLSHQLAAIHRLAPENIIEIGIGSGFTSSFLKHAGYHVTTVDINESLQPDICSPLQDLPSVLDGRRFDLVVCCEVLEHTPLADLPANISALRKAGDRLFMTLPNYARSFGVGVALRLPKQAAKIFGLYLDLKLKKNIERNGHFWEVGSDLRCTKRALTALLRRHYNAVEVGALPMNPYHISFTAF